MTEVVQAPTPQPTPVTSVSPPKSHTCHPDYQDADADFTIHSSDHVLFKVHSYHLLSQSEILRVRLKDTGQNKLLLGFPPYNSATVKLFLDLLYGKVIPEPKWSDLYIYKAVIIFAKEYKCPAIMRFILGTLQSLIDIDPFDAFCAGSYVGDLDLCAKAIAAGGNHSFFVDYPGTATQEAHIADNITDKITGGSIFNIASWQSSDLEYIKHAHVIALARATADVNWKKPAKQNWAKIASRFLELTKPQAPPQPQPVKRKRSDPSSSSDSSVPKP